MYINYTQNWINWCFCITNIPLISNMVTISMTKNDMTFEIRHYFSVHDALSLGILT